MIKLAISGKMGSGKNLFLELAQKNFPELKFEEEKFAYHIYESSYVVQSYLQLPKIKDGKLLQLLGAHYRNEYSKDFWVDKFFDYELISNHILTDLRFPNELAKCQEKGYTTVRIKRQEEFRLNNILNRDINHESEIALDNIPDSYFDYTINNNGSIGLLEGAVISIITNALRSKS